MQKNSGIGDEPSDKASAQRDPSRNVGFGVSLWGNFEIGVFKRLQLLAISAYKSNFF